MTKKLIDLKAPRPRFARSINVERDAGSSAIDGYLPVGRAIDALDRLATALGRNDVEVALSITGPYGSGKSSLAIIIDALLGPKDDPARRAAEELLVDVAPRTLERLHLALERLGADEAGFIRATVTAAREPVVATVLRALIHGATRFTPAKGAVRAHQSAVNRLKQMELNLAGPDGVRPEPRAIRTAIEELSGLAPILILIDEFGKNLEAFADAPSKADLFLLQELAEWTRGQDGIPLALVTLQHMAFDEYASGTSAMQRREWAKIQGRFEDVPFIDSPAQTRSLIAAAFGPPSDLIVKDIETWATGEFEKVTSLGSGDLLLDVAVVGACWPLHPIALAILPDLCERYGQNERTLFSFLAGHEPKSVASFLTDNVWVEGAPLPAVRLDALYDYFVDSAASMVAISSAASRWIEIDNRIRDTRGISEAARRVLKTVGLLNLVSAGGTVRASRPVVGIVAADGREGTESQVEVLEQLAQLEEQGLITYREFADECRVWQGSDFDLKSAVDLATRRVLDEPADAVLNGVMPLSPVVAARHSQKTGTLRIFERRWIDPTTDLVEPLSSSDRHDGLLLYVLGPDAPKEALTRTSDDRPLVFLTTEDPKAIISASREVEAINEVLSGPDGIGEDWVAYRELHERRLEALASLEVEFERAYGATSGAVEGWCALAPANKTTWLEDPVASVSSGLSDVADRWYARAPEVRNDLINRHDLSSQGAKARRIVLEAMLRSPEEEGLGITGEGPDRTLYLSVLQLFGLHQPVDGQWGLAEPPKRSQIFPAWNELTREIRETNNERRRITELYERLSAPPFGIRPGLASVMMIVSLIVNADEVALYEHGTFKPVLTDDICERLIRNPGNFEVKHYANRTGLRAGYLTELMGALGIKEVRERRGGRVGSVLAVVSHLVALVNMLPEYTKRTKKLSADAVAIRRVLMDATEPDQLVFVAIPEALGGSPIPASGTEGELAFAQTALRLANACAELRDAYAGLMGAVRDALRDDVGPKCEPLQVGLSHQARELEGKIIDPQLERLTTALKAQIPDEQAWLAYVAMNTTGTPPEGWTDDDRRRFFVLIAELGGSFQRIYKLNASIENNSEGFDAYRHVITRSDGREVIELLAIDEEARTVGLPLLESVIDAFSEGFGVGASEATKTLLALLGEIECDRQLGGIVATLQNQADDERDLSTAEGA